jgi:hypothetical protein
MHFTRLFQQNERSVANRTIDPAHILNTSWIRQHPLVTRFVFGEASFLMVLDTRAKTHL